jgi:hypothetical protein
MAILADCSSDRVVIAALTRFDLATTKDIALNERNKELAAGSLFAMPNRVSRMCGGGSAPVPSERTSFGILLSRSSA